MSAATGTRPRATGAQAKPEARPLAAPDRRRAILTELEASGVVPGDVLAERFGVSRQAIVHDVAILRASGAPIVATVRGYLLAPHDGPDRPRIVVAVRHRPDDAVGELTALVDLGVRVVDVVVEHPVYGELRAELHVTSRADVEAWAESTRQAGAHLLSELTDGVHLHTLEADVPERLAMAEAALDRLGYRLADDHRPG
jgi:hypothetical protein